MYFRQCLAVTSCCVKPISRHSPPQILTESGGRRRLCREALGPPRTCSTSIGAFEHSGGLRTSSNAVQGGSRRLFKPPAGVGDIKTFKDVWFRTFEIEPLLTLPPTRNPEPDFCWNSYLSMFCIFSAKLKVFLHMCLVCVQKKWNFNY